MATFKTICLLAGTLACLATLATARVTSCNLGWDTSKMLKANDSACQPDTDSRQRKLANVPLLSAVHCNNDGTGLCKALAGRFEFQFNSFTGEIMPVEQSQWVGPDGFHSRMPVAYTPYGNVLYFDRALKWAIEFTTQLKGASKYNLLNTNSFNWCEFALDNSWPYKSVIRDHDNVHHIYFFNRQTCVHNTQTGKYSFYNTRFQGNSDLLLDLDQNPVIFAMQDHLANNEIRLVRHKRLHWFESKWRLEKRVDGSHQLQLDTAETSPCQLCNRRPLLPNTTYKSFTDLCVNDFFLRNAHKENLIDDVCGLDQVEMVEEVHTTRGDRTYEFTNHNLPGRADHIETFLGAFNRGNRQDCERFSSKTSAFIAGTYWSPRDTGEKYHKVLTIYSQHDPKGTGDPEARLTVHNATRRGIQWDYAGLVSEVSKDVNYVDDFIFLRDCLSVLIVYGPLYSELPIGQVNLEQKAPLGPISALGVNEPVNALLETDDSWLFFYVRTNHVIKSKYRCPNKPGDLVTATRQADYFPRYGDDFNHAPHKNWFIDGRATPTNYAHSEEQFFKSLGLYKGNHAPDAPDPAGFLNEPDPDYEHTGAGMPAWAWILVIVVLLVIIAMSIAGYLKYNQQRRPARPKRKIKLAGPSTVSVLTKRSAMGPAQERSLSARTNRSVLETSMSGRPSRGSTSGRASAPGRSGVAGPSSLAGKGAASSHRSSSASRRRQAG